MDKDTPPESIRYIEIDHPDYKKALSFDPNEKDSTLHYFNLYDASIAKKLDSTKMGVAQYHIGKILIEKGILEEGMQSLNNARHFLTPLEPTKELGLVYKALGRAYEMNNERIKSLETFLEAENFYKEVNSRSLDTLEVLNRLDIARTLIRSEYLEEALLQLEEIKESPYLQESPGLLAELYTSLASIHSSLGNSEESIFYFERALNIVKGLSDLPKNYLVGAWLNLSGIYIEVGKFEEATPYVDSAYNYAKKYELQYEHTTSTYYKGLISKENKQQLAFQASRKELDYLLSKYSFPSIEFSVDKDLILENTSENSNLKEQRLDEFVSKWQDSGLLRTLTQSELESLEKIYKSDDTESLSTRLLNFLAKSSNVATDDSSKNKLKNDLVKFTFNAHQRELAYKDKRIEIERKNLKVVRQRNIVIIVASILLLVLLTLIFLHRRNIYIANRNALLKETEYLATLNTTKNEELTDVALLFREKNQLLETFKDRLQGLSTQNPESKKIALQTLKSILEIDKEKINSLHLDNDLASDFIGCLTHNYPDLTKREIKIATLVRLDKSSKDIANQLNISSVTVDNYRHKIRKKLELSNTDDLTIFLKSLT
ncbi:transcriptional regulator [Dokdonia sinensis]|nr:LuxR family transcriptional regulator [Dokdonia sinensis]